MNELERLGEGTVGYGLARDRLDPEVGRGSMFLLFCDGPGCDANGGGYRLDGGVISQRRVVELSLRNGWTLVDGESFCPACGRMTAARVRGKLPAAGERAG